MVRPGLFGGRASGTRVRPCPKRAGSNDTRWAASRRVVVGRGEGWVARAREEARRQMLGAAHETLDVTGTLAVDDKYPTRADATRSSARAMLRDGRRDREQDPRPTHTRVGRRGAGRLDMV